MAFIIRIAGAALLLGAGLSVLPAQAAYVVTLTQQGPNVLTVGNGTIDTTNLTFLGLGETGTPGMSPPRAEINFGPSAPLNADFYTGFTGPGNFGSGGTSLADSASGDAVTIAGTALFPPPANFLGVPKGYVSGSPLSDMTAYDNQTFASLGVTPGSYIWTWGSGAHADSFTLDIGAAAVPEPSSLLVLAMVLAGLLRMRASRRNRHVG